MEKRSFVPQETRKNKMSLPASLPETGVIFDGRAPQQDDSLSGTEDMERQMARYDTAFTSRNLIK